MFQQHSCEFFCEACVGMYIRVLHAGARGWWVGRDEEHTRSFPLPLHIASRLMQHSVDGNRHVQLTTFSDGCLGSNNDEGRSEVR